MKVTKRKSLKKRKSKGSPMMMPQSGMMQNPMQMMMMKAMAGKKQKGMP